jgi:hypothetical protein
MQWANQHRRSRMQGASGTSRAPFTCAKTVGLAVGTVTADEDEIERICEASNLRDVRIAVEINTQRCHGDAPACEDLCAKLYSRSWNQDAAECETESVVLNAFYDCLSTKDAFGMRTIMLSVHVRCFGVSDTGRQGWRNLDMRTWTEGCKQIGSER